MSAAVAMLEQASVAAVDVDAIDALFALPFADLLLRAQHVHRAHHAPNAVQLSTLMSIKTGGCPEDCGYCPQAARYHTGVDRRGAARCRQRRRCRAGREGRRRDALLHGRRVARPEGARPRAGAGHGDGGEGARPRDLLHARHAEGRPGRAAEATRASTTTTTISTRRPSSTATSSRRATTATGSTRWTACATPASPCAAAASSAWANRGGSARG